MASMVSNAYTKRGEGSLISFTKWLHQKKLSTTKGGNCHNKATTLRPEVQWTADVDKKKMMVVQ